jgi:hypothetical protein
MESQTLSGNDRSRFLLPEQVSDQLFHEAIAPYVFDGIEKTASPSIVFVGGQPGSGKSALLRYCVQQYQEHNGNTIAEIVGDDFRAYHPKYAELLDTDDETAAFYTDKDVGRWIEKSLRYAAENVGCSVALESTLRQPNVVCGTMHFFKEHGYTVNLNILLAHSLLSRLGVIERYLAQMSDTGNGRFTVRESHDASYDAIPDTVNAIFAAGKLNQVSLYNRGAKLISTWHLEGASPTVTDEVMHIIRERRTHVSRGDRQEILTKAPELLRAAEQYNSSISIKEINLILEELNALTGQTP